YGALLSNLVFIPLANKLKYKDEEEMFVRELIMEGLLAVQESENPRIVRQKMESYLRPSQRATE
ncbi:MAG: motility protein A, partial [Methylophaga sp.]|nr:motility protein A [Methylophaga sp.]